MVFDATVRRSVRIFGLFVQERKDIDQYTHPFIQRLSLAHKDSLLLYIPDVKRLEEC
jgi:hypothetical protein